MAAAKNQVMCPVCHTITGELLPTLGRRWLDPPLVIYNTNAAGPDDGYRCTEHRRSVNERFLETRYALAALNASGAW